MIDLRLEEAVAYGNNTGRGNLLGIEPYMVAADYASAATLRAKLDGYLQVARQRGWLNERTIVVWPEHIAAWLVAADERDSVYRAPTLNGAMAPIVLRHLLSFVKAFVAARERDKVVAALFRIKADDMARDYHAIFSGLAREYKVTMVAGSTVLPAPWVEDGQVRAGRGPLYNVSAVFGPDGRPHTSLVRKAFPVATELPFTTPAPVSELPAFTTSAGRLGVLICADSWYPEAYAQLKCHGVEWLAVPSGAIMARWASPWRGYSSGSTPDDVDTSDVGTLTEGQAWHKYALAGRIGQAGARGGIHVFLRGELWDLHGLDGHAILVRGAAVADGKANGAAVMNLWLS
jgi:hypothetical protein